VSRPRLLDLPHGHQAVIDEADWSLVESLTLYVGTNGYVYFSTWENGRSMPRTLHGFLMKTPKGMHTDHINGNKLDNRRANLRLVTPSINGLNRRGPNRGNSSGIRGVSYSPELSIRSPWRAQIMVGRKQRHLGLFATKEEALAARRAAEVEATA
jgi:hypothetical protein